MGVSATAIDNELFRQSQTHQGVQADFWGLKNLICFLLNKRRGSLASLTPQTQNQRARAGRQMPPTAAAGAGTPTPNKRTPRTQEASGQRLPYRGTGKGLEGRKGGLTGERLALLSFHHDKFFLSGELSIKMKVSTVPADPP